MIGDVRVLTPTYVVVIWLISNVSDNTSRSPTSWKQNHSNREKILTDSTGIPRSAKVKQGYPEKIHPTGVQSARFRDSWGVRINASLKRIYLSCCHPRRNGKLARFFRKFVFPVVFRPLFSPWSYFFHAGITVCAPSIPMSHYCRPVSSVAALYPLPPSIPPQTSEEQFEIFTSRTSYKLYSSRKGVGRDHFQLNQSMVVEMRWNFIAIKLLVSNVWTIVGSRERWFHIRRRWLIGREIWAPSAGSALILTQNYKMIQNGMESIRNESSFWWKMKFYTKFLLGKWVDCCGPAVLKIVVWSKLDTGWFIRVRLIKYWNHTAVYFGFY